MPESPSPVLSHTSWAQCTCNRCETRRLAKGLLAGCPCKQCQPGPGLDFDRKHGVRTATRRAEMRLLLKKNDAGLLTPDEEDRFDYLCHGYIHGD